MEFNKDSSFAASSLTFYGAIFMCNRTTMRECMKKKLFGLPRSHMSFVKKIKSGMILFLFEYEARKLYGIYEATCDGALDIEPRAFTSSGKSFTAQIQFRIIRFLPPLSENMFSDAIKDNYYTVKKFHFSLSREQVDKLIGLFVAALETNIRRSLSSGMGKKAKKQSREYCNTDMTVSFRNDIVENDINIEKDLRPANFSSHPSLYRPDLNCSGYHNKSILNTNDPGGNGEPLFWTIPYSSELRMTDPMPSTSQNDGTVKLHGSPHHDHPCYHGDLGFKLKPSPLFLGGGDVHGSMEDVTGYPKSVADGYPGRHLYLSHTDLGALESSSNDYLSLNSPRGYKLSAIPKEHEPFSLGSSLGSRYFEKAIDTTNLEFHNQHEPYIPASITRGFGMKRITKISSPSNPGEDPLLSFEFRYSTEPPHRGSYENTRAWSTAAVPLSETKDLGRNVSPFHFSSFLESSYQDEGPSFHQQPTHHEELTTLVSNLRSGTYHRKSSVFSRLSVNAEINTEDDDYNSFPDSALSGFMKQVEMKKGWRHVMKRSMNMCDPGRHTESTTDADVKDADALDNEEKLEDSNETEIPFLNFKRRSRAQRTASEVKTEISIEGVSSGKSKRRSMNMCDPGRHTESSADTDVKDADALDNEEKLEDSNETEISFLNFKRRSRAQRTVSEVKTEIFIEGVSSGKSKRRKLIRPSFDEASSAESTAKCLNVEGSFQELCGCDVTALNADAEQSEVLPNRIVGERAGKDGSSQVMSISQKSAENVKTNERLSLESVDQLADGSVGSEGNRTASLIGGGQTSNQSNRNTCGLSEVVNRVVEDSPLGQFDSWKDINFRECCESNESSSINECDEVNVGTASLIGEGQTSDESKGNTSGSSEVVKRVDDTST